MGFRRSVAGVVSGLLMVGFASPVAAEPGGVTDPGEVWEGPYLEGEAPVKDAVTAPREAVDRVLPGVDLGPGDEVVAERTESSKTFVGQEPGVFETRLYGEPVHFVAEEVAGESGVEGVAEWVEFDTDLVAEGPDRVGPAASDVGVSIAESAGDEDLVRVEVPGGGSVSWGLVSVGEGAEEVVPVPVAGDVEGPEVSFPGVAEDVGVVVTATPSGVKEDVVLAGPDAATVYEFAMSVEGLSAVEAGGGRGPLPGLRGGGGGGDPGGVHDRCRGRVL